MCVELCGVSFFGETHEIVLPVTRAICVSLCVFVCVFVYVFGCVLCMCVFVYWCVCVLV